MALKREFTGQFRHRAQQRLLRAEPLMVLQLAVRITGYDSDMHGDFPDVDYIKWEDATAAALTQVLGTELGILPRPNKEDDNE